VVTVAETSSSTGKPVHEAADRHPQREGHEADDTDQRDRSQHAEPHTVDAADGAGPHTPECRVATERQLGDQQEQAEQHEHTGQHVRGRAVERRPVLVIDPGRQRGEAQHLEGAELGQEMQPDQQGSAEHGRADTAQDHTPEDGPAVLAERVRHLLERRVEGAHCGHGREVDEGGVGERHDHHGPGIPLHGVRDGDPAVAVHEGGDRERRHEQHVPEASQWQVGALHQPGARDAQEGADGDHADQQSHGVADELADAGTCEQLPGGRRAERPRVPGDIPQWHEHHRSHESGCKDQPRGCSTTGRAQPCRSLLDGQRNPASCIISTTLGPSREEMSTAGGSSSESGFTPRPRSTWGLRVYSRA
jgi:hypothetical protein